MSSKLLRDTGEALYGPRWQTDLAQVLGISDRTIRRWVSGADDVPSGAYLDLWRICEERVADIEDVIPQLKVAARHKTKRPDVYD